MPASEARPVRLAPAPTVPASVESWKSAVKLSFPDPLLIPSTVLACRLTKPRTHVSPASVWIQLRAQSWPQPAAESVRTPFPAQLSAQPALPSTQRSEEH